MPTAAEFQELFDNCTSVWTTLNGVNGRMFTSNVNGNTLFLPAAGYYDSTSLVGRGSDGYYWSNTYDSEANALRLYFSSSGVNPQGSRYRHFGYSVRAILGGTPNRSIVPPTPEDEPKEEETPTEDEPKDKDER